MEKIIINDEECREILTFERYSISESGRVYRTKPYFKREKEKIKNGTLFVKECKMHYKVTKGVRSKAYISITDNEGKLHNVLVVTLVAIAFGVLNATNRGKKGIGYKDGNKDNLHYTNLFVEEKRNANYKLNKEDVKHIKKQIKKGIPLRTIGRLFAVSEMQISRIRTGENWGNGKRKIKAPKTPFTIRNGRMRAYVATFNRKKTTEGIKKRFTVKRNPNEPTDNLIVGIINGYKLTLPHKNITRAKVSVETLNEYFFNNELVKERKTRF